MVISSSQASLIIVPMVTRLEFWSYPLLIGLVLLGVIVAGLWGKRSGASLVRLAAFGVYLLVLLGAAIFPIPIGAGALEARQPFTHILARVNWAPFYYGNLSLINPNALRREIFLNILMTLPFGLGIPFVSRVNGRRLPWIALAVGLGIELSQLAVSLAIGVAYRGVDINDVLLNALGVLAGYRVFRGLAWAYTALARKAQP